MALLAGLGLLLAQLAALALKLGAARQQFQREAAEPVELFAGVFPLLENESRFLQLVARQVELADRLSSLKDRDGEDDPALKALRLAVRGGFNEAMVNQQIGFIYLFQQKWKEAKDAFDLGLAVDPRFAPMYYWRAMAWDKLGRKDNMLLDLDRYVKLAPNGPDASRAKAILKSSGG